MHVKKQYFVVLSFILMLVGGCAWQKREQQELDVKVAEEPVKTQADLESQSRQIIEGAGHLTLEQKQALLELRSSNRKQSEALREESSKLRAVLLTEITAEKLDQAQVSLIKKRIKKNEDQRLNLVFGSVAKANRILGRPSAENRQLRSQMFDELNRPMSETR